MSRAIHRLSAVKVATLKAPGYYLDGGGLYFRVALGGSRSWIFRFTLNGKTRDKGLGGYPAISLAKARQLAERDRQLVASGVDPIAARDKERAEAELAVAKQMTFEDCAKAFIASYESSWTNPRHRDQWRTTLQDYVYPIIGKLPVGAIDTAIVMKVLEPIWNTKTVTASRVRGRIETVLNWAKARGCRTGENPALWRGHLDQLLPKKSKVHKVVHHAALAYADIPAFMAKLRDQTARSARALEFLVLTATRTGETLEAPWSEINLKEKVWVIPAERMKAEEEHRVPLSPRAVEILEAQAESHTGDLVFESHHKPGRPQTNMALLKLLARLGYGHVTSHGFRSCFRDWCAEETNFQHEVCEMALAHKIPDATERAYRRGNLFEKRRRLMQAWAGFCGREPMPAKVVPFTRRTA
jgi:integrase